MNAADRKVSGDRLRRFFGAIAAGANASDGVKGFQDAGVGFFQALAAKVKEFAPIHQAEIAKWEKAHGVLFPKDVDDWQRLATRRPRFKLCAGGRLYRREFSASSRGICCE